MIVHVFNANFRVQMINGGQLGTKPEACLARIRSTKANTQVQDGVSPEIICTLDKKNNRRKSLAMMNPDPWLVRGELPNLFEQLNSCNKMNNIDVLWLILLLIERD